MVWDWLNRALPEEVGVAVNLRSPPNFTYFN